MTDPKTDKSEQDVSDDVVTTDEDLWSEMDAEQDTADLDGADDADDADEAEESEADPDEAPDPEAAETKDTKAKGKEGESDDLDLDALREQNDRLEKQFRSEQNRSIGQQRRADRLQKKVQELEAKLAASQAVDDGDDEEMQRLQEEYPDVAGPILKRMERLQNDKPDYDAQLAEVNEELKDIEEAEIATFTTEHPEGFSYIRENIEEFRAWVQDQPKETRDLYEKNRTHMVDGTGAALLLTRFKNARSEQQQTDGVDEQRETTGKLTAKRNKQLSGATSQKASARTTKIVQDDPSSSEDPEKEWEYWDRQDRKRKA